MVAAVKGRGAGEAHAKSWFPSVSGTAKTAKDRAAADAMQRRAAAAVILNAKDVQGDYDAKRMLMTTLGGSVRAITGSDLKAFRENVKVAQTRYRGGIRARNVLDLSLPVDRKRANTEIRLAVPVAASGGKVRFQTNAGPESDVTYHHVFVDFLAFPSASSGGSGDAKAAVDWMRREPLKIECDCGRWRYWFRYIATIGRYNAGRDETGYPKIRNPNLHGVACKHILRVMAEVESSAGVAAFLRRLVERARGQDNSAARAKIKKEEAERIIKQQQKQGRAVDTTMLARQRARERAAIMRVQESKPKPPKRMAATTGRATGKATAKAAAALAAQFGMTPDQVMSILAQAKQRG